METRVNGEVPFAEREPARADARGTVAGNSETGHARTHGAVAGTVFFDYDGTLHDSMRLYGPAFRQAYAWLVEGGHMPERELSDEWISRWLGWEVRKMWNAFAPELPEAVWREASLMIGREMDRLLEAGEGRLFDGIPVALDELRERGFELAFLSNCGEGYCERHRSAFGLDRWLGAYYCAGAYPGLAKWEIYQQAAREAHALPHVMVGDRFHDIEVAVRAGIPSVGCAYGFGAAGELESASVVVRSPADLPQAVEDALGGRA